MSPAASPETPSAALRTTAGAPRPALDDLRAALNQMLGAERRLRGREHAPGELTYAHIRSLHALGVQGELTAGQLARSAELNPASVTAMLDQLEGMGIVSRARSTTDRRVMNVSLTPQGRELLETKTARWRALWQQRLEQYSDTELEIAERVIRDLSGMFDSITKEREAAAARSE